jgi:hypothetical protein
MDTFFTVFAVVMAIGLGIFAVTILFKVLGFLSRLFSKADKYNTVIKAQSFIATNTFVKVHLEEGHVLDQVTFLGFTMISGSGGNTGEGIPFELQKMAVFQYLDARKIYVRPEAINSIEELPTQTS